jgi:hypothetical protein
MRTARLFFCLASLVLFSDGFSQSQNEWDLLYPVKDTINLTPKKKAGFEPGPLEVTQVLDRLVDSLAIRDLKTTRVQGYRILLYSGNEREEVARSKEKAYRIFRNADVYLTYKAPTFKLTMGNYYHRLDAFFAIKKLEAAFPFAVMVPEIVQRKP